MKNKVFMFMFAATMLLCHNAFSSELKNVERDVLGNLRVIEGVVMQKGDSTAIEWVTVAVADSAGMILSGATTSSEGKYKLVSSQSHGFPSDAVLIFSLVGYKEKSQPLYDLLPKDFRADEQSEVRVKAVLLEEDLQMLEGAVVADKRPLVEHKFDRLVVNVSELAVAQTGDGLDVLKSSPGVTVDKDGNILLNGRAVSVWIDGRPSNMSGKDLETYLKGSTGNTIEKVELITNPSSKYDAEGEGGIINIKTKKGFMQGLNGSLGLNFGADFLPEVSFTGNISAHVMYKTDKTNTTFRYNPGYYGYSSDLDEFKFYGPDKQNKQTSNSLYKGYFQAHNIELGNDWHVSGKDIIGVNVRAGFPSSRSGNTDRGAEMIDIEDFGLPTERKISIMNSKVNDADKGFNITANINWTHTFNESRNEELTLNADYSHNESDMLVSQRNTYSGDGSVELPQDYGFNDITNRGLNLYSFKADWSRIFWKGTGRLEAGAKAVVSTTANEYGRYNYDFVAETLLQEASQRNDFTYCEQIYAMYANVAKQFSPKWNAQVGLRGEFTVQQADWITEDVDNSSKKYMNVFPSASLGWIPTNKTIFSLNYSYRISRPKYWQMNPFRSYTNATTYSQGDPMLQPSYSHDLSFSAVLFNRLSVTAGYSLNQKFNRTQVPKFDPESAMMGLIYANAGDMRSTYISASLAEQPLTKWWNLTVNAYYSYSWFKAYPSIAEGLSEQFNNNGGSLNVYLSTTFFLPKSFKIALDGWCATSQTMGFYRMNPMWQMNLSVNKTMWDGKGTIALRISDLALSMNGALSIRENGKTLYYVRQGGNSLGAVLGFTWRFGKSTAQSRRNVGRLDEQDRM